MLPDKYGSLTFELFDRCLRECESLWCANDAIYRLLTKHGKEFGEYVEFGLPTQTTSVIQLLGLLTHDDDHWIDYWCYELGFGKFAAPDTVTIDGEHVPLYTTKDLWSLLLQNAMYDTHKTEDDHG